MHTCIHTYVVVAWAFDVQESLLGNLRLRVTDPRPIKARDVVALRLPELDTAINVLLMVCHSLRAVCATAHTSLPGIHSSVSGSPLRVEHFRTRSAFIAVRRVHPELLGVPGRIAPKHRLFGRHGVRVVSLEAACPAFPAVWLVLDQCKSVPRALLPVKLEDLRKTLHHQGVELPRADGAPDGVGRARIGIGRTWRLVDLGLAL